MKAISHPFLFCFVFTSYSFCLFVCFFTQGLQWCLLAEEEIAPSIIAMDGRHNRRPKSEHEITGDATGANQWKDHPLNISENNFEDVRDAKLLRRLEAQGQFTP